MVLIVRLWELDQLIDQAHKRAADLKAVVVDKEQQIATCTEGQLEQEGLLQKAVVEEAGVQQELDRYIIRRDRTAKLLEGGSELDYVAVERQLVQCGEKVDELENSVLELMEKRDGHIGRIAHLGTESRRFTDERAGAHAEWVRVGRLARTEIETLMPRRAAALADLTREQALIYGDFRKRTKSPITYFDAQSCGSCHVSAGSQIFLEVSQGRRVHQCRGCDRWLLVNPVLDEQLEEA
jgi:predicted  nucleic acid-binding Zn-ribbon protein